MGRSARIKSPLSSRWAKAWLTLWIPASLTVLAVRSYFSNRGDYSLARSLQAPSWAHPMGFDPFGNGVLTLVLEAGGRSIGLALILSALTLTIAGILGPFLAVVPPKIQEICVRFLDAWLAFPTLLVSLGWAALRGPGWETLVGAILVGTIPSLTRIFYLRASEVQRENYYQAAISLGASPPDLVRRHLFPAVLQWILIKAPNLFAQTIIAEATLSFLGLGAPLGTPSWGALLLQGREYLIEAPHIALGAGIPLVLTTSALMIFAERYERSQLNS